ncbi:putative S-adenosyl-L-methionine-dependent methyltransferase-domain-containing protein [Chaetomium tenue]|uniref:S-adenosyl-L-methionine-dependent methyltransferase-domain-containing protein n=1 Tax=Chaetomium tenue TaxID=1854479 RepID=A0ACB7P5P6_9PEZI|nr:putative S-adenosyl-L-methionine-dependent methyltransferase-domain-containing protein [Chaetomium globosum]
MKSAALRTLRSARHGAVQPKSVAHRSRLLTLNSLRSSLPHCPSLSLSASRHFSSTAANLQNKSPEKLHDGLGEERKWSTPLAKQLGEAIEATGPVPLASYMRMCLTADIGGYYTGALEEGRDQFGLKGDFVTSPEISQVFGELCAIWYVTEWMAQGRPTKGVELIEVGPGRGTLMDDMLRTIQRFPAMANSIDAIYMVEASPELRVAQKNLLCGEDAPMTESKVGYHSVCKYNALPIVWTETIKSIPIAPEKMPFIMAHEFFDALPIHAFELISVPPSQTTTPSPTDASSPSTKTSHPTLQWRELLVSPTPPGSTHTTLNTPPSQSRDTPPPDFQLTRAQAPTRHALYLPESSPRYRALKKPTPHPSTGGGGALIEISPDAALYASDFATRIGGGPSHPKPTPSGAALILDYGPGDGSIPTNSLRGIRRHRRVSPFAEPGLTDLSADVDFAAVAEAATRASEGVEVHGPVGQGGFLEGLGIRERVEMLVRAVGEGEGAGGGGEGRKKVEDVKRAWARLVDRGPNGMGKLYKALAILPENEGRRRPVGFGGGVVG